MVKKFLCLFASTEHTNVTYKHIDAAQCYALMHSIVQQKSYEHPETH